jgi:hypothetical protein
MRKTVYIETTIPSLYFNRRTDAFSLAVSGWTQRWWDERRSSFDLVTSVFARDELLDGDHPDKADKLRLLASIRLLPETDEIDDIVSAYIANKLMPADSPADAAHLAYASYFSCEYLLTWNCRHIANHNKEAHLRVINGRLGLTVPKLVTPHELLEMGDEA